jgi:hypothetical protein
MNREILINEWREIVAKRQGWPQLSIESLEREIAKLKEMQNAGCNQISGQPLNVSEMISEREGIVAQIIRIQRG